jgi:hypothetical protein
MEMAAHSFAFLNKMPHAKMYEHFKNISNFKAKTNIILFGPPFAFVWSTPHENAGVLTNVYRVCLEALGNPATLQTTARHAGERPEGRRNEDG